MEKKVKEIEVYVVNGIEFEDEQEAVEYNSYLRKSLDYTYYTVKYSPDEDGVYHRSKKVAVPQREHSDIVLLEYCINNFGTPLVKVNGTCFPFYVRIKEGDFHSLDQMKDFRDYVTVETSAKKGDFSTSKKGDKVLYLHEDGTVNNHMTKIMKRPMEQ